MEQGDQIASMVNSMDIDLTPKLPTESYAYDGAGGSYATWSPDDLPMLRVVTIGAAKLLLNAQGLALPTYSDSLSGRHLQGSLTWWMH